MNGIPVSIGPHRYCNWPHGVVWYWTAFDVFQKEAQYTEWPGPWFNIKMPSYQYRKSHCGDKTVVRSSYLHNGISYTGKMTSSYWIRALLLFMRLNLSQFKWPKPLNVTLLRDQEVSPSDHFAEGLFIVNHKRWKLGLLKSRHDISFSHAEQDRSNGITRQQWNRWLLSQ